MGFSPAAAAAMYVSKREDFDSIVAPLLTDDMLAEVMSAVADARQAETVKSLARQVTRGTDDETVGALARQVDALVSSVDALVPHIVKSANWSGRALSLPLADGRRLKVTLTDGK